MSQKIQSKVINYIEQSGEFKDKRTEFAALNKQYRQLAETMKPKDVVEQVQSVTKDASGKEVTLSKEVKRKVFPSDETKELYDQLKVKRKQILRFSKYATLYVNMICDKMIQDFINSCEPTQSKKTNEKTYGWKQFNHSVFQRTFSYSLASSSKYFNDFLELKNLIPKCDQKIEIDRLKQRLNKADVRNVYQDLQLFKQIKLRESEVGAEETAKKLASEFGSVWGKRLSDMYSLLFRLQAEDNCSKLMFNSVKNATKQFQEGSEHKAKISNGFKCLVSKVVLEFLQMLSYKIEVFLSESTSKQIRLADIRKIIHMTATLESVDELKTQLNAFNDSVQKRISDIESAKSVARSKSTPAPTNVQLETTVTESTQ